VQPLEQLLRHRLYISNGEASVLVQLYKIKDRAAEGLEGKADVLLPGELASKGKIIEKPDDARVSADFLDLSKNLDLNLC
jgi:hypothetical protein